MAEGGPDTIFEKFLSDSMKQDRYQLELALGDLTKGYTVNLVNLRFECCNARLSESFRKASMAISPIKWDGDDGLLGSPVGDIFLHGRVVLELFLDKTKPQIPVPESSDELDTGSLKQRALLMLLKFISSKDHGVLLQEKKSEAEWSVTIAQHLLSKLAVNSTYTITPSPEFTLQGEPLCPCKEMCQLSGKIGDTSFGCKAGWHGSSDIIMEDYLTVSVFKDGEKDKSVDEDRSEDRSVSSIDNKLDEDFTQKDLHQIIAQTVVFSFLQRKVNKEKYKNFLVPGIGISGKKVLFCFYDSENDVLLASKPMELFKGNALDLSTIVILWLTLNYPLFCTGITEEMNAYTSDFFKRVDDRLIMYVANVERPMHVPCTAAQELYWQARSRENKKIETIPGVFSEIASKTM